MAGLILIVCQAEFSSIGLLNQKITQCILRIGALIVNVLGKMSVLMVRVRRASCVTFVNRGKFGD